MSQFKQYFRMLGYLKPYIPMLVLTVVSGVDYFVHARQRGQSEEQAPAEGDAGGNLGGEG